MRTFLLFIVAYGLAAGSGIATFLHLTGSHDWARWVWGVVALLCGVLAPWGLAWPRPARGKPQAGPRQPPTEPRPIPTVEEWRKANGK